MICYPICTYKTLKDQLKEIQNTNEILNKTLLQKSEVNFSERIPR